MGVVNSEALPNATVLWGQHGTTTTQATNTLRKVHPPTEGMIDQVGKWVQLALDLFGLPGGTLTPAAQGLVVDVAALSSYDEADPEEAYALIATEGGENLTFVTLVVDFVSGEITTAPWSYRNSKREIG